jgi:hypothetical protein
VVVSVLSVSCQHVALLYNPTVSILDNKQRMVKCISHWKRERRGRHDHLPYKVKDSWIHMLRIKSKNGLCCKGSRKRYNQNFLCKFPHLHFLFYLSTFSYCSFFPHIVICSYVLAKIGPDAWESPRLVSLFVS